MDPSERLRNAMALVEEKSDHSVVSRALLETGRMLRRRGFGSMMAVTNLKTEKGEALDSLGVHSCWHAERVCDRSKASEAVYRCWLFRSPGADIERLMEKEQELHRESEEGSDPMDTDAMRSVHETFEDEPSQGAAPSNRSILPIDLSEQCLPDPVTERIAVIACSPSAKPGVYELTSFLGCAAEKMKVSRVIVITQEGLTNQAKKERLRMRPVSELFVYPELLYDPVQHDAVPPYRILDGEQRYLALYRKYVEFHRNHPKDRAGALRRMRKKMADKPGLQALLDKRCHELGRNLTSDRMCRYYGLEEGDLVIVTQSHYVEEDKSELRRIWPSNN